METAHSLRRRLRGTDPRRADVLLALALLVEFELELALLVPGRPAHRGLVALLLAAWAAVMALRRRAPVVCVACAMSAFEVTNSLPSAYADHLFLPFFTMLFSLYSLGRYARRSSAVLGSAIATALYVISSAIHRYHDTTLEVLVSSVVLIGGPVLLGAFMRDRARLHRALRDRAAALQRSRAERAEQAVSEERARIASELHDVVACALGAMTVQAAAARRLVPADAERARGAFAAVEGTGREALDEIRRLLGVLRREDDDLALAPQPSLRHLGALACRVTAAGLPVGLSVEGDVGELPAGVDLTAYRVVQEALGAALEGGGAGRARVLVRCDAAGLLVEVADDGATAQARPLVGVRERVAVHGGQLFADDHFLRVRLPLGGAE